MSSLATVINNIVEEQLLNTSTAFIGKIIAFDKDTKTANVQPLTMTKAYGKEAKQRAVLTNIPVTNNAQYKLKYRFISCDVFGGRFAEEAYIEAGDLCVCIVSDRDITEARKGNSTVPSIGHHDIQNAIVVGVL